MKKKEPVKDALGALFIKIVSFKQSIILVRSIQL